MKQVSALFFCLMMMTMGLSGCLGDTGEIGDAGRGENSRIENIHAWQDGWVSDTTLCKESIVLKGGEVYICNFSLPNDDWVVIDLEVDNSTDPVDLITLSDLNYQKWQDGEEYVFLEDWTEFQTFGAQYGKNIEFPGGDWFILVINPV